jgi:hypothetical protein
MRPVDWTRLGVGSGTRTCARQSIRDRIMVALTQMSWVGHNETSAHELFAFSFGSTARVDLKRESLVRCGERSQRITSLSRRAGEENRHSTGKEYLDPRLQSKATFSNESTIVRSPHFCKALTGDLTGVSQTLAFRCRSLTRVYILSGDLEAAPMMSTLEGSLSTS